MCNMTKRPQNSRKSLNLETVVHAVLALISFSEGDKLMRQNIYLYKAYSYTF